MRWGRRFTVGMLGAWLIPCLGGLAGCEVEPREHRCDWGERCPAGTVCHAPTESCEPGEQVAACRELSNREPCQYPGAPPDARCVDGVCGIPRCGDGVRDPGEGCDCGTDPVDLPFGCGGINGEPAASCSVSCVRPPSCGDGVKEGGEECDCGLDPNNLPAGCEDVNGGAEGSCDSGCVTIPPCRSDTPWGACDPLRLGDCCADSWDAPMECVALPEGPVCLRACADTLECYWNTACNPLYQACLPVPCGGTSANGTPMLGCAIDGGVGICVVHVPRTDPMVPPAGRCVGQADPVAGLAPGEPCTPVDNPMGRDRSEPTCAFGRCLASQGQAVGRCQQYCSWEQHYDHAIYGSAAPWRPCPGATRCVGLETIDPVTGLTGGDFGLCREYDSADPAAPTTCSVVTGQLLGDPSRTCGEAGFANGRCVELTLGNGERANGTLIGTCFGESDGCTPPCGPGQVCAGTTCLTLLGVWDPCTPGSATHGCPPQTVCAETDAFAPSPTGATRCLPQCDTDHPAGPQAHCAALGAAPVGGLSPTCTSWSQAYGPNGQADVRQSRLGLCLAL